MSNEQKYDLEERTSVFGKEIIIFCKNIPSDTVNKPLISQLVRSGTSVGANYHEANNAESRKDFIHKIGICKKEAKETKYWLQMVATAHPIIQKESDRLWQEAKELTLIFSAISNKTSASN